MTLIREYYDGSGKINHSPGKRSIVLEDINESVELLKKYGYDINQDDSYRIDDL